VTFTYKDIHGYFGPDQRWLYRTMIVGAAPGFCMVEIGAFKGRSTCFAAQLIQQLRRDVVLTTVDHFLGSAEHQNRRAKIRDMRGQFELNMKKAGVRDLINVLAMPSVQAAAEIDDESQDFIFIDGSHDYRSVREDILAWQPKLKPGGLLAGDDYVPGWPGVRRAVNELILPVFSRGRLWSSVELLEDPSPAPTP
jgi:predicted O-methyltransferase YrrM